MGVIAAERRRFGGWTFEIGEESGSATPGEVGVWLVEASAGSGLATGHLRSFFFEPAPWQHAGWDAASRIGEHPDISVHEWRPAQLRLASPHPNRNKAFGQAVVTLAHSIS